MFVKVLNKPLWECLHNLKKSRLQATGTGVPKKLGHWG